MEWRLTEIKSLHNARHASRGAKLSNCFPNEPRMTSPKSANLLYPMYGDQQIPRDPIENNIFIRSRTQKCVILKYISVTKTEVLKHFKEYKAFIENQTNKKLKHFRSDSGGEFINMPFKTFCAEVSRSVPNAKS